jgi:hypothetical protein
MRTVNNNGIITTYVNVKGKEVELYKVYSELRELLKIHIDDEDVYNKADDLLMAIYFPLTMAETKKETSIQFNCLNEVVSLWDKIKFLENNAFTDRVRIGELENRIEKLEDKP